MRKQIACMNCAEINDTVIKVKTSKGNVNLCETCNNELQIEKSTRKELLEYIVKKQLPNEFHPHPHSLKQLKDLHDKGYSYKELLFYAKFYYEKEKAICKPEYANSVAWYDWAIKNADAYMEMTDLSMDEIEF